MVNGLEPVPITEEGWPTSGTAEALSVVVAGVRDVLRLKPALGRRAERLEGGRGGRFCEVPKAAERLGEDADVTGDTPREGRGRPNERR